jgi:hypothetical protein
MPSHHELSCLDHGNWCDIGDKENEICMVHWLCFVSVYFSCSKNEQRSLQSKVLKSVQVAGFFFPSIRMACFDFKVFDRVVLSKIN